jgi:hypothetical protein
MIWDFGIVYLGVSLAIAGWHLGLMNSWPAPIAMILSTGITQLLYVNVGAFLLDGTRLPADVSFFIAYVILWIIMEAAFEYALLILIPVKKRFFMSKASRVVGACIGVTKAVIVLVFATAAGVSSTNMPAPPPGLEIVNWVVDTQRDSILLRGTTRVAAHMPMQLAQRVVSEQSPLFHPTFEDHPVVKVDKTRAQHWHQLFEGLRNLESELSQL